MERKIDGDELAARESTYSGADQQAPSFEGQSMYDSRSDQGLPTWFTLFAAILLSLIFLTWLIIPRLSVLFASVAFPVSIFEMGLLLFVGLGSAGIVIAIVYLAMETGRYRHGLELSLRRQAEAQRIQYEQLVAWSRDLLELQRQASSTAFVSDLQVIHSLRQLHSEALNNNSNGKGLHASIYLEAVEKLENDVKRRIEERVLAETRKQESCTSFRNLLQEFSTELGKANIGSSQAAQEFSEQISRFEAKLISAQDKLPAEYQTILDDILEKAVSVTSHPAMGMELVKHSSFGAQLVLRHSDLAQGLVGRVQDLKRTCESALPRCNELLEREIQEVPPMRPITRG